MSDSIEVSALFPTIVVRTICEDFSSIQDDIIDWCYSVKETNPGQKVSNQGGWQSAGYFEGEEFSKVKDYLLGKIAESLQELLSPEKCQGFRVGRIWVNINGKNAYNEMHDHPNCNLSGVLWVKSPENCGRFKFDNPNSFSQSYVIDGTLDEIQKTFNNYSSLSFDPLEGHMLVFPSNLKHGVEMNQSDKDRISIAFNIHIER